MGLGLNQSTDGGKTFRELRGMHSDHHALWIDPANSDNLLNGNDGGVVMSFDGGKTWRQFLDNLPVVTFFNVMFDNGDPLRVYGSVQDHGSYRAIVDLSRGRDRIPAQKWDETIGGEGSNHAIDTSDNNTVYASSFYGNLDRADFSKPGTGTGFRATPYEVVNIMPKAGEGEASLRGQWMAPTIVSPHDPKVVYHGLQYVYRSMHRGDTWERISPDLVGTTIRRCTATSPTRRCSRWPSRRSRFGLLYAGTDDGRLHVTRDGGKAWTELTANLPQKKWISRVVPSAFDEGTVYVTQNGKRDDDFAAYIYKSTDFGKTFTSIVGNIPGGPVNVIREDPSNPKILYVGTDMGAVRVDRRRGHLERAGRQPAAGVRARPGDPAARPADRHRDARPRRVAARRGAGAVEEVAGPAGDLRLEACGRVTRGTPRASSRSPFQEPAAGRRPQAGQDGEAPLRPSGYLCNSAR